MNDKPLPRLGQGTWRMGERADRYRSEVKALQLGFDLGMTLVDTAEMYGEGKAEILVGEAIAGRREDIFLVSKVYPYRSTRSGVVSACEQSLKRLKTDYLDLYLLHWRGSVPLAETIEGFQLLKRQGRIREFGVSNFDHEDMEELMGVPGGTEAVTDQVLYNVTRRGIEWDLLPWCRKRRDAGDGLLAGGAGTASRKTGCYRPEVEREPVSAGLGLGPAPGRCRCDPQSGK